MYPSWSIIRTLGVRTLSRELQVQANKEASLLGEATRLGLFLDNTFPVSSLPRPTRHYQNYHFRPHRLFIWWLRLAQSRLPSSCGVPRIPPLPPLVRNTGRGPSFHDCEICARNVRRAIGTVIFTDNNNTVLYGSRYSARLKLDLVVIMIGENVWQQKCGALHFICRVRHRN